MRTKDEKEEPGYPRVKLSLQCYKAGKHGGLFTFQVLHVALSSATGERNGVLECWSDGAEGISGVNHEIPEKHERRDTTGGRGRWTARHGIRGRDENEDEEEDEDARRKGFSLGGDAGSINVPENLPT